MKKGITNLTFLFFLSGMILTHSSCDFVNEVLGKSDPNKPYVVKTFHPTGKLKSYYTYKNEKKNGVCRTYYPNGKMHMEVHYVDDMKHGLAKQCYQTGRVYRETPYVNGEAHGVQKKYFKSGELMAEVPYVHGKQAFGMKEYNIQGKVLSDYPEINIKKINQLSRGKYIIELSLTEGASFAQFYVDSHLFSNFTPEDRDQLMIKKRDAELLLDGYFPVLTDAGKARIELNLAPGMMIDQEVTFAVSYQTRRNNTYFDFKKISLKILA